MKRLAMILGIVVLAGAIAIPVLARGPGWGKGGQRMGRGGDPGSSSQYGRGYDNLTEEQRTQLDKLHQKFYDETAQLRTEIWAKRGELRILMNTSNPDVEKAKALQKEISDLMGKMAQEKIAFQLEARKINPGLPFGGGFGKGYGRHMKRYGPGMGYGHHRGGYGPGMGPGQYPGGHGPGYCWN
ncbi:MAG: Spy/CpxP family protein refolding chaperone [Deltaproteobacteria bacterium]|nr:Spy/CpxP family protein refolding chaperone [Deltaproteobacteria bacterium]